MQNFNTSLAVLSECRKKTTFEKYLVDAKNTPESHKLELSAFLIMPVQRVPRYNLLLKDLFKHTWTDHLDYENLKQAVAKVQDIAGFLNEKKREAENMAALTELAQTISGNPPVCHTFREISRKMDRGC